ncbi:MAG: glycosyltransferase [Patescibacteria group bacterium]|jgi:glycosyltransferase involved in cell wall biosynthesis
MRVPVFSIIIPCRSMCDFLRENISYLRKLEFREFEVLIILDEIESFDFKGDSRFRILRSGSVGPGQKRNIGAMQARGDILAFLDDDAYPHPKWLSYAHEVLSEVDTYALGSPAITPLESPFLETISGRVLESIFTSAGTMYRHIPMRRKYIDDYPTVNLFVKRKIFLDIGGFDENFWPGEDTKLCLDMLKKMGRKFLYDPKPIVYHHRRALFAPHLKQISRYGRYRGQFAKTFPETSRRFAYFVPSLFVLWVLLGPVIAMFLRSFGLIYIVSLWIYVLVLLFEGIRVTRKEGSVKAVLYFMQGVFLTHFTYGLNFIIGFVRKPQLELRDVDQNTGNYLGG